MAEAIEFDWDEDNRKHLKSHRVSPQELEQVIANDPLDMEYTIRAARVSKRSKGGDKWLVMSNQ